MRGGHPNLASVGHNSGWEAPNTDVWLKGLPTVIFEPPCAYLHPSSPQLALYPGDERAPHALTRPTNAYEPTPSQSSSHLDSPDDEEGSFSPGRSMQRWTDLTPSPEVYDSYGGANDRGRTPPLEAVRPPSGRTGVRPSSLLPPGGADGNVRYCCRFPGCMTEYAVVEGYATTDGVRKHCRAQHSAWLRSLPSGVTHFAKLITVSTRKPSGEWQGAGRARASSSRSSPDFDGAAEQWAAGVLGATSTPRERAISNRHGTRSAPPAQGEHVPANKRPKYGGP